MRLSPKGLNLIASFEGLRLEAYKCPAGVWTIGYGSTKGVHAGQTITEAQALDLLRADVATAEAAVNRACAGVKLSQGGFDALVSFTFNCGTGAFAKSTLLKKVRSHDFIGAAAEFAKWNKAGGKVLPGLTRRRQAEAALFRS